jgi:hypothetical protein
MVLLHEITLTASENCDEAAEASIKLKLYLRSIDILLHFPQIPTSLKLLIGMMFHLINLTEALFLRTMTTDRPEAVQALSQLFEGNNYSECVKAISKVGTGFDTQSKRDHEMSVNLDLVLGGKMDFASLLT